MKDKVDTLLNIVFYICLGLTLLLMFVALARADDKIPIYDSQYGGKVVGAIGEDGTIYDSQYGGKAIGKVEEDGTIKDKRYGGRTVGRIGKDEEEYNEWNERRKDD